MNCLKVIAYWVLALYCDKQIVEPLISKQWFVTMEPLAEKALKAVEKGELTIMPERFEKVHMFVKFCVSVSCNMFLVAT